MKYLSHSLESPLHPCLHHITTDQNTEIAVTFLKTCSLATVHSESLRKIDVYDECGNPTWAQDKIFFPQVAIWVLKFSFPGTSLTFAEVVVMPWCDHWVSCVGACLGALTNDSGIQGTVYKGAIQRQHETQHNQVGPLTLWFDSLSLGNASSLSW